MKLLIKRLKPYKKRIILGQSFKFTEVVLELAVPFLIGKMVDKGILLSNQNLIVQYTLICLTLAILGMLSAFICQYQASIVSQSYGTELRNDLFNHILKISSQDVSAFGKSSLITRITSDIQILQQGVAMLIRLIPRTPFICVGVIIMAWLINPIFVLPFILAIIIFSFIIIFITKSMLPHIKKTQTKTDRLMNKVIELLSGIKVIRATAKGKEKGQQYLDENEEIARLMEKIGFASALLNPLTLLALNLIGIGILWIGSRQMQLGNLLSGDLISLVNYLTMLLVALTALVNLVLLYTRVFASAHRVEEVMLTQTRQGLVVDGESKNSNQVKKENIIEFNKVNFAFPASSELLFENFSFELEKGKSLSIIGPTGAGKSTLAYLLERRYHVSSGEILLFSKPIESYPEKDLLDLVQIIPQRAYLFSGTLRENLTLGLAETSEQEIWTALEIAQAKDFVKADSKGLDQRVERGGLNFSGGQRQRLSIARALLRDAKIIVFDDTSSALDLATDAALQKALKKSPIFKETGFITITQRISTAQRSDKTLLLSDGKKMGFGSHAELLANNSLYQEIYASQINQDGGEV